MYDSVLTPSTGQSDINPTCSQCFQHECFMRVVTESGVDDVVSVLSSCFPVAPASFHHRFLRTDSVKPVAHAGV